MLDAEANALIQSTDAPIERAPATRLLSIVIPTFNRVGLLQQTIESALAQTVPCEIVVVDHGSTDATPDLAASYGDRIVYVRRVRDDGPCLAWLDGVLRADGALVHLNYDDDWIAPTFAEKTIAAFADDVGVVFTNATVVGGAQDVVLFAAPAFVDGTFPSAQLLRYLVQTPLTISPGCATFRRRDALDALMINPVHRTHVYHGAGPDLQMFLTALSRAPSYRFIDEPLAYFRSHDQSITMNALQDNAKTQKLLSAYSEYKFAFLAGLYTGRAAQTHVHEAVQVMFKQVSDAHLLGL